MTAFIVSASHVSENYRLDRVRFPVDEFVQGHGIMLGYQKAHPEHNIPETYYASLDPFGCGKDASTPQAAIRSLLQDNGCYGIIIEVEPVNIEGFKVYEQFERAGQETRLAGKPRYYGCHYGMQSTRSQAIAEFNAGWDEIETALSREDDAMFSYIVRVTPNRLTDGSDAYDVTLSEGRQYLARFHTISERDAIDFAQGLHALIDLHTVDTVKVR